MKKKCDWCHSKVGVIGVRIGKGRFRSFCSLRCDELARYARREKP